MLAVTTWPDVGLALVTIIPGLFAAYFAFRSTVIGKHNRESLKTPSGTTIGKQVEQSHHTALANNYRLQALGNGLDVPLPEKAAAEEKRVEALNDIQTEAQRADAEQRAIEDAP